MFTNTDNTEEKLTANKEWGKKCTCVLWRAHARVVVDSINAGGVVFTVIIFTVIDVDLTFVAFKTLWTHTPENHTDTHARKKEERNKNTSHQQKSKTCG